MKNSIYILIAYTIISIFPDLLSAQDKANSYLGERLHYNLEYLNVSVGTMDFAIHEIESVNSVDAYHLEVTANTNRLFSPLFRVNNKYESYFDTASFLPHLLKKRIKQKNIEHQFTLYFDQKKHHAVLSDTLFWDIPDSCFSFFSMLYFLRSRCYSSGDTLQFYMDSENLMSRGQATLIGEENLSLPLGTFKAIKINLEFKPLSEKQRPWKTDLLTNRLAKPNSAISLWLSDDELRLPLIFQFQQKGFDVKMILNQFEHP